MLSSLPTPPPNSPFLSHKYTEYHETPSGDFLILKLPRPSLVAQLVKNPPAMQETPLSIPGSGSSSGEGIGYPFQYSWAFLVAQLIMNPPAMWETWVRSLGWEGIFPGSNLGDQHWQVDFFFYLLSHQGNLNSINRPFRPLN